MQQIKTATNEFILLMLAAAGIIAVTPFAVIRFMNQEWLLCLLDGTLIAGLAALSIYVRRTHNFRFGSLAVSVLCQAAIVGTIYIQGVEQVFWAFPAVLIVYYLLPPTEAFIANLIAVAIITPPLMEAMNTLELTTVYITLAATIAFSYAFAALNTKQQRQMELLATQDALTGAGNRRALGQKMRELLSSHHRQPMTASLLLLDLDHFKRINDDFGHAAGDEILTGVVAIIQQRIRETDSLYRFGGEEFLVIAEGADDRVAQTLAEDLRERVEQAKLIASRSVTISVGIAALTRDDTSDDWLRRADEALYVAKDAGRNTTISARALTESDIAQFEAKQAVS